MDMFLIGARVLLSAVFLVAGVMKLADREGSIRAMNDFGTPTALSTPLGIALPWIELLVAVALLPAITAWYAALAALILLSGFVAAIAINLALGQTPDCHCFGQLHSAPAGWSTLLRNVILALLAAMVAAQGLSGAGPSAIAWIADLSLGQRLLLAGAIASTALLAAQSFLLFQVLRQQGRLLVRMDVLERTAPASGENTAGRSPPAPIAGLPIGSPAPVLRLGTLQGGRVALQDKLSGGKPALIVFVSPGCGPCSILLPEIARWQRDIAAVDFIVVSEGAARENRVYADKFGISEMLLQEKREAAVALRANGTPAAILIRADGSIGSGVALGTESIRTMVARALGLLADPPSPPAVVAGGVPSIVPVPPAHKRVAVGETVPPIELESLDGRPVALPSLRGEPTLLLFWNTGCGFCQRMLDELRVWEAEPPPAAPRLVVISAGQIEQVRAMKLRSLVLLENDHRTASAFGANGTPMAVLLDAEARVASSVAAGGPAVLALAAGLPTGKGNGAMPMPEPLAVQ